MIAALVAFICLILLLVPDLMPSHREFFFDYTATIVLVAFLLWVPWYEWFLTT